MRSLLPLLAAASMSGAMIAPTPVKAEVSSLLFTCNLSFQASGKSIYLGVGFTDVYGKGQISCYDYGTGATQHIPIKITARGPGAGLGVTGLAISGGATGIGLAKGPEALLGRYVAVRGGAAAGVGVGAAVALRLSNGAATIDASIQAQGGLGAGVDLLWIDIQADGETKAQLAPPAQAAPTVVPAAAPVVAATPAPTAPPGVAPLARPVTKVVYVSENQPVHVMDSQGRLLQVLYLKRK